MREWNKAIIDAEKSILRVCNIIKYDVENVIFTGTESVFELAQMKEELADRLIVSTSNLFNKETCVFCRKYKSCEECEYGRVLRQCLTDKKSAYRALKKAFHKLRQVLRGAWDDRIEKEIKNHITETGAIGQKGYLDSISKLEEPCEKR